MRGENSRHRICQSHQARRPQRPCRHPDSQAVRAVHRLPSGAQAAGHPRRHPDSQAICSVSVPAAREGRRGESGEISPRRRDRDRISDFCAQFPPFPAPPAGHRGHPFRISAAQRLAPASPPDGGSVQKSDILSLSPSPAGFSAPVPHIRRAAQRPRRPSTPIRRAGRRPPAPSPPLAAGGQRSVAAVSKLPSGASAPSPDSHQGDSAAHRPSPGSQPGTSQPWLRQARPGGAETGEKRAGGEGAHFRA